MDKVKYTLQVIISMLILGSCSVSKYIPENEKLYTGGSINLQSENKIRDLKEVNSDLQALLKPQPNSSFLGMKIGLHAYYKAQTDKSGPLNKFINKKFGEEPVYLSDIDIEKTEELIYNRLENRGFFRSEISSSINERSQSATIDYNAQVNQPYRIKSFEILSDSSKIYESLEQSLEETLIKNDKRFDLVMFKQERARIDKYLKKTGYYNFNSEFILFEADTNRYEDKGFDLFLRLKENVPQRAIVPYNVSEVFVYPNYTLNAEEKGGDTTYVDSIAYIQDYLFFKPERLHTYLLLEEGDRYSAEASSLTSDRLSSIGTYKYVNIRYDNLHKVDANDTLGHLKATISLSPLNKRAIRAEVQALSKSNNFIGPALALSYANRNLFKGGELINFTANYGYERQVSSGEDEGLSSTQFGLNGELVIPRLVFPIDLRDNFKYSVPKTKIDAGIQFLDRTNLYRLNSLLTTYGYSWKSNSHIYHDLNPISINYVKLSEVTEDFQEILDENPFLSASFEQQFIVGATYTFTYSELADPLKPSPFYLSVHTDIAGNALSAVSRNENENGASTILGQEFAQYFKTDVDIRYHFNLKKERKIVTRLFLGAGLPYGNSESLPFSRQYFSGGPYSVRAFRIRSIGPGIYQPNDDDSGSFFDQAGDVRLEGNVEYRFPISGFFKGAVFFDAGNVWLLNENSALPGGKFSSNFINELAMGSGVGLRVDIQNFVIRLDLATPLKKPWATFSPELAPMLNFAIGYPF